MLFLQWWYLPVLVSALAIYWRVVPSAQRKHWLTTTSIAVLLLASWRSTLAFLVITGLVYLIARELRRGVLPRRQRTALLTLGIVINVGYLATFKYLPAYAPPAAQLLALFTGSTLALPLGVSYFTFRFLHYVIEARRGSLPAHGFGDFLSYASLFTIFPAGPIERFGHFAPQVSRPVFDPAHISDGLVRILTGSIKKILVADLLIVMFLESLGRVSTEFDGKYSWRSQLAWLLGRLLLTYFDFSGYTDMAVGTTRLFGIRAMENFDRPLIKTNLSDFWRAWHMSLTGWCRDYIYFPVFGLTRNPKIAVYASMLVLGAWHGTRWGWLVWGAWQATGLAMWQVWQVRTRRWPWLKRASESPLYDLASWALTITWVTLGAAWTSFDSLRTSAHFILDTVLLR